MTTFFLPVQSAFLRTKIDTAMLYVRTSYWARTAGRKDFFALGVDANVALLDRLELGASLPFATLGFVRISAGSAGEPSGADLGNLTLKVKGRLGGSRRGTFAVSLYSLTTLPTGSGLTNRAAALWQAGVAFTATARRRRLAFGASAGWVWAFAGRATDFGAYTIDLFGAARLGRFVALQLTTQLGFPLHPSADTPGVALTPALQLFPHRRWRVDLGVRLAANDAGLLYTPFGRAALVFALGYNP